MDKLKQQELEAKQLKDELAWFEGDIEIRKEKPADEWANVPQTPNFGRSKRHPNRREQHDKYTETNDSRRSFEIVFNTKAGLYREVQYRGYVTINGRTLRFSDHTWQSGDHKKSEYNFGGVEGISIEVAEQIRDIVYSVPDIQDTLFISDSLQENAEKKVVEEQKNLGNTYIGKEHNAWQNYATLHFKDSDGNPFDLQIKDVKTKELEAKNRAIRIHNRANVNKAIAEINEILRENGLKTIPEY